MSVAYFEGLDSEEGVTGGRFVEPSVLFLGRARVDNLLLGNIPVVSREHDDTRSRASHLNGRLF